MSDRMWRALRTGTWNAVVGYVVISAFVLLVAGAL